MVDASSRIKRYRTASDKLMQDAASAWTSTRNKPLVAFDAAYLALLSALPNELSRSTPDHPCEQLAGRAVAVLGLSKADVVLAEHLAKSRYYCCDWIGSQVFSWAQRVRAAAFGG